MNLKSRGFFLFFFFVSFIAQSQSIRKSFLQESFDSCYFANLQKEYGKGKKLPIGFEKQALLALSYYPELKDTKIDFRTRKKNSPLMVRPTVGSAIFRSAKKRRYIVFISSHSSHADSILMKNLPLDAQIGVLGHELAHIAFFNKKGRWGMMKVALGNFSRSYLDRIEFETDRSAIEHGLGWQLLSWSEYVRIKLRLERWRGADEYIHGKASRPRARYMNPETIRTVIAESPVYHSSNQNAH